MEIQYKTEGEPTYDTYVRARTVVFPYEKGRNIRFVKIRDSRRWSSDIANSRWPLLAESCRSLEKDEWH